MKKLLAILLAAMMLCALAACGEKQDPPAGSGSTNSKAAQDSKEGEWPDNELTRVIPKPPFTVKKMFELEGFMSTSFDDVTYETAKAYIAEVKANTPDFNVDVDESYGEVGKEASYVAYNADGWMIDIGFGDATNATENENAFVITLDKEPN